jgi:hypothetical protein
MRHGSTSDYALSVAIVCGFALTGIYAFSGSPFKTNENADRFERPAWSREINDVRGYPAYRLRSDGSSLAIGRVIGLGPEQLEVSLFPDMVAEPVATSRVILMPTNASALWALVPTTSKQDISTIMENLAGLTLERVVKIVQTPDFNQAYRERLQLIIADAYQDLGRDPSLNLATKRATEILRTEYAPRLSDILATMVLPRVRQAALEMLTPSWAGISDFLSNGTIDMAPLGRAATDVLSDEKFLRSVSNQIIDAAADPRIWRFGVTYGNALITRVSTDPRIEALMDDITADPAFRSELRALEQETARAITDIFSRVVGRGLDMKPDTLAVRIVRYILLRRPRMVAVILPKDQVPPSDLLTRFSPLTVEAK